MNSYYGNLTIFSYCVLIKSFSRSKVKASCIHVLIEVVVAALGFDSFCLVYADCGEFPLIFQELSECGLLISACLVCTWNTGFRMFPHCMQNHTVYGTF
jgi:hypothetical protein